MKLAVKAAAEVLSALACPQCLLSLSRPHTAGASDKDPLLNLPAFILVTQYMHFSLSLSFFCSLAWLTLYALLLSFHHLHSPLRSFLCLSFLSFCIYFSVLKAFNLTVAQCHPSMVHYKDWKIAFSELSINVREGETLPPDSLSLSQFDNFFAAPFTLPCPPHVSLELLKC